MAPKTVLITGCSVGGIGHGLAIAFQKRGLHVFATARSLSKMSELSSLPNLTLLSLDVTSPTSIAAAVKSVEGKTGGRLDYLVNNSGSIYLMPNLDSDMEVGKKMFDVNVWGVLAVTQAFAPMIVKAKGTVVNNGSVAGLVYAPWQSLYNASKAAMNMMSETLRLELAPFGVNVVTIITGAVASNISNNGPTVKLPADSLYRPIEPTLIELGEGKNEFGKQELNVYAENVVSDVLGGAKGKIWRGKSASLVKWAGSLLPQWWIDVLLKGPMKMDVLDKAVKSG